MKGKLGGCGMAALILALGGAGSAVLCCGGSVFLGGIGIWRATSELSRADRLYENGQKADAVIIYKDNFDYADEKQTV